MIPVTAVAGQAGSLDTEDHAHGAGTPRQPAVQSQGNQPVETGSPKLFINDLDSLEAELVSLIGAPRTVAARSQRYWLPEWKMIAG
jgi:hypothetical protein